MQGNFAEAQHFVATLNDNLFGLKPATIEPVF